MKKAFEYNIKREIEFEQLQDNFYVYKEAITVGDKEPILISGVITKETVDTCNQYDKICNSEYALYNKEILEHSRNNLFSNSFENFREFLIKNPYDYFIKNGFTNVVLVKVSYYDYNIYDIYGNKYPKAIYFDYMDGSVDNSRYKLPEALEILKNRSDIELITKNIKAIPYYNSSDDRNEYLSFIWRPSDEDFEKIKDFKNKYDMYEFTNNQIFKFPKKDEIKIKKYKLKK